MKTADNDIILSSIAGFENAKDELKKRDIEYTRTVRNPIDERTNGLHTYFQIEKEGNNYDVAYYTHVNRTMFIFSEPRLNMID